MFRFKQFSVEHERSAMKVGVDGVLVGCWADTEGSRCILDVGCGCGLISLIMAQRCPEATVLGIDIDMPSVEEAKGNVLGSPWSERVRIENVSFPDGMISCGETDFDLIVSNPPYFNSGISDASTRRKKARHQGELSPLSLINHSRQLLRKGGSLVMVIPAEEFESVEDEGDKQGFKLVRKCRVRGHCKAPWKRLLLQWVYAGQNDILSYREESLTLEVSPGQPTDDYRRLCKDFYLKF